MKKVLFIISLIVMMLTQRVFCGDTKDYTCLQVEDCVCTGYTTVLTVEWITEDTIKITRNERESEAGDSVYLYNLTPNPMIIDGNEGTIECGQNTWFVPFDPGYVFYDCSGEFLFVCDCEEGDEFDCIVLETEELIKCKDITCPGCCEGTVYLGVEHLEGGGLLLNASKVIYEQE